MLENAVQVVPGAITAPVLMLAPLRTAPPAPPVRLAPAPTTSPHRTLDRDVHPAADARHRPPYDAPPPLRHVLAGLACALVPSGALYRWLDRAASGFTDER